MQRIVATIGPTAPPKKKTAKLKATIHHTKLAPAVALMSNLGYDKNDQRVLPRRLTRVLKLQSSERCIYAKW